MIVLSVALGVDTIFVKEPPKIIHVADEDTYRGELIIETFMRTTMDSWKVSDYPKRLRPFLDIFMRKELPATITNLPKIEGPSDLWRVATWSQYDLRNQMT